MTQQIIDIGAAGADPTADEARVAFDKVNDNFTELYAVPPGSAGSPGTNVRFVSKSGSDSNSGTNWGEAKLTIAAAMAALPQVDQNGVNTGVGQVYVSPGAFTENGPLRFGGSFQLIGSGTGPAARTLIVAGNTSHLFQSAYTTSSAGHGTMFANVGIRGRLDTDPTATQDLLTISGGFNCVIRDCSFDRAPRWAVHAVKGNQNIMIDNCTMSRCGTESQGGALFVEITNGPVVFLNSQLDSCGVSPIKFDITAGMLVSLRDIKLEMNQGGTIAHHAKPIHVTTVSSDGTPMQFLIENIYAGNWATGQSADMHESVIYEETSAVGVAARFALVNVRGDQQYAKAFKSARTGQQSTTKFLRHGMFGPDSSVRSPGYEVNGIGWFTGAGSPEGAVTAPIGCFYLNTSGGASTTLYVKTSGTGNTGWTAK